MEKSAKVKFAKATSETASGVYLESFVKQASANGIPVSEENLPALLKTAAALRAVAEQVGPIVKKANNEFIETALNDLLAVEL